MFKTSRLNRVKTAYFPQLRIFLAALFLAGSGCSNLDRYERVYTMDYSKDSAKVSMTLRPIKGYAK